MKRMQALFLSAYLLLTLLAGCHQQPAEEMTSAYTAEQIMVGIESALPEHVEMTAVGFSSDYFEAYLTGYYQLDAADLVDGALCFAGGVKAREIAVLRLGAEAEAAQVKAALETYQTSRAGAFTGYAPEEAALVEGGRVVAQGQYVALLLCEEPAMAEKIFRACFTDQLPELPTVVSASAVEEVGAAAAQGEAPSQRPENTPAPAQEVGAAAAPEDVPVLAPSEEAEQPSPVPPPEAVSPPAENPYDGDAVLRAWQTGDETAVSGKSQLVLDKARAVLREIITDDMTSYEKELAVHDWMIKWAEYDPEALDHSAETASAPDNQNPYGLLMNQKAICSGYSTTFQLFMDMLEIECITVHGTAHQGAEPHAWNMVRLEDEWYCVDLTWDDPIGLADYSDYVQHRYFNVTTEYMSSSDHQWEQTSVPEATATKYAY